MPLKNFKLEVEFVDGTKGIVELNNFIQNKNSGVFSKLKDLTLFNQVVVEYGAVTWPGEIDLAPDAMYDSIKKTGIWNVD